jgi:hypothetical protein
MFLSSAETTLKAMKEGHGYAPGCADLVIFPESVTFYRNKKTRKGEAEKKGQILTLSVYFLLPAVSKVYIRCIVGTTDNGDHESGVLYAST